MKKVIITVEGEVQCVEYCSQKLDWDDHYVIVGFTGIEGIYVDDDDRDISEDVDSIENTTYFKDKFSGDQSLPVDIRSQIQEMETFTYELELPDGEEFDIEKLKMPFTEEIPSLGIHFIAEYIIYNGEKVPLCYDDQERYVDFYVDTDDDYEEDTIDSI